MTSLPSCRSRYNSRSPDQPARRHAANPLNQTLPRHQPDHGSRIRPVWSGRKLRCAYQHLRLDDASRQRNLLLVRKTARTRRLDHHGHPDTKRHPGSYQPPYNHIPSRSSRTVAELPCHPARFLLTVLFPGSIIVAMAKSLSVSQKHRLSRFFKRTEQKYLVLIEDYYDALFLVWMWDRDFYWEEVSRLQEDLHSSELHAEVAQLAELLCKKARNETEYPPKDIPLLQGVAEVVVWSAVYHGSFKKYGLAVGIAQIPLWESSLGMLFDGLKSITPANREWGDSDKILASCVEFPWAPVSSETFRPIVDETAEFMRAAKTPDCDLQASSDRHISNHKHSLV